jgi:4'-phosphopantetheinyl transferase EntD
MFMGCASSGTQAEPAVALSAAVNADRVLVERLQAPPLLLGRSAIRDGDEDALKPDEAAAFQSALVKVRRQSGAARIIARSLLELIGEAPSSIPKSSAGAPLWPVGIVGSLAHDETMAVAVIARRRDVAAVGVDVEPHEPLAPDLVAVVATATERRLYDQSLLSSRRLFAAKEAVFKATFPIDGVFLDFHDIEVDFAAGVARVNSGRRVHVTMRDAEHLIALAYIAGPAVASGQPAGDGE